jgi:imidazole glycerol-phosphate synthase subunit HisH
VKRSVSVIDYGAGNLLSVGRAFERCGGNVAFVTTAEQVAVADYLVLPGVGAFRDGIRGLAANCLDEAIKRHAASGKPLLGICLGMQMLSTASVEFGTHAGLGLVPGQVLPIAAKDVQGDPHKVPYVGWADLEPVGRSDFQGTPLAGVRAGEAVYLVHSYHCIPDNAAHILAVYDYGGIKNTAAIHRDNVIGYQFHPEKSGAVGLAIIDEFLKG